MLDDKQVTAKLLESKDYAYVQYNDKVINNTEARLTSPYAFNKGTGAYFEMSNNQVQLKKDGVYLLILSLRLSAMTTLNNVKRFSIWRNGVIHTNCMGRLNTWEDLMNFELLVGNTGDILTFYAKAEDGNSTISRARAIIIPLK